MNEDGLSFAKCVAFFWHAMLQTRMVGRALKIRYNLQTILRAFWASRRVLASERQGGTALCTYLAAAA